MSIAIPALLAGTGTGFWGTVISGVAGGAMSYLQSREEEKKQEKEQQRRTNSYQGFGDAVQYWKNDSAPGGGGGVGDIAKRAAEAPAVGQRPDKVGQRHRDRAERAASPLPSFKFDRERREIVRL